MRITVVSAVLLLGCSGEKTEKEHPLVAEAKRCDDSELACSRPILNVASLRASQAYYRDKLGFTVDWDHGDPPNFGSVSRAHFVLFQCEKCQMPSGAWTMTFTPDLEKLYQDFKKRGAIIKMPPTDMPWGLREMHVADPDGNVIRFAHHGHD